MAAHCRGTYVDGTVCYYDKQQDLGIGPMTAAWLNGPGLDGFQPYSCFACSSAAAVVERRRNEVRVTARAGQATAASDDEAAGLGPASHAAAAVHIGTNPADVMVGGMMAMGPQFPALQILSPTTRNNFWSNNLAAHGSTACY